MPFATFPLYLHEPTWERTSLNRRLVPKPAVSSRSKQASYSITSSARASSVGGTVRPSVIWRLRKLSCSCKLSDALTAGPVDRAVPGRKSRYFYFSAKSPILIAGYAYRDDWERPHRQQNPCELMGWPYPPPPGVSIVTSSLGCISILRASLTVLPLTRKRPVAPGAPPSRPSGGSFLRLATALSNHGLVVRMRQTTMRWNAKRGSRCFKRFCLDSLWLKSQN